MAILLYLSLVVSFLFGLVSGAAASDQAPSVKDIFVNVWHDQSAILTSPLRMDRRDAAIWMPTALSFVAMLPEYGNHRAFDEKLLSGIDRDDQMYGGFFKRVTYLGDGSVLFGASLATYGISSLGDYEGAQHFSARWIEALTDASIWVTMIKMAAGRNRPQESSPESEFRGPRAYFKEQGVYSSFPSGHTTLAFATAAVMTRESDNNPWVGVPAYLVAGGVGFSRMYVEKHWLTDVLFGAALGHSIGTLVENRRKAGQRSVAWRLQPQVAPHQSGLVLVYQW